MVRARQIQPGQLAHMRPALSAANRIAWEAASMLGYNPSVGDVMTVIEIVGLETEDGIVERLMWLLPRHRTGF